MVKIAVKIRIDDDELVEMLRAGMTYADIAEHYSTTKPTISKIVRRLRGERDDVPPIKMGRKTGSSNRPKKPFLRELYERTKNLGID